MIIKNIKRNPLDYILTDILPVEVSELFTYRYFYDFLQEHSDDLCKEIKNIIKAKNNTNEPNKNRRKLFQNKQYWVSIPLKYNIIKGNYGMRMLSILQPMAVLQIYYFIAASQEEILIFLEKNSVFSLRFHKKSNSLYYRKKRKNIIEYFSDTSEDLEKRIFEQTGEYFKLSPYKSLSSFINSDEWFQLTLKYKHFARIDYKSCFDSIYTHTYKWILSRDVNDSKNFYNAHLFTTIDRILQNINAFSSNGLIVGPEFSRMIAELLLQQIDASVYSTLLNQGFEINKDYSVKRFVDDIYIFAKTDELQNKIIKSFQINAGDYLLSLNENKIIKEKIPFIMTNWITELNWYSADLSNTLFYTYDEMVKRNSENKSSHFKTKAFLSRKNILERNFNDIISKYGNDKAKLTTYILKTLLHKITRIKINNENKNIIFRENVPPKVLYGIIDFVFFIYSNSTTFSNTQIFISILSYFNDDISDNKLYQKELQKILNKYAFIFSDNNTNDIINLLLLCIECSLEIPFTHEINLWNALLESDNPINIATFLVYSKYNNKYFEELKEEINKIIDKNMKAIQNQDNILTYKEFWWLLIFNKSPYINTDIQDTFNQLIKKIEGYCDDKNSIGYISMKIFCDFLEKSENQYFSWNTINDKSVNLLREITYRTHERTLFGNYKYSQASYSSVE